MKNQVINASDKFWRAMEAADAEGMRAVAVPDCTFVHIGVTCQLEKEIEFYTKGLFKPTELVFHSKDARVYGDTAIVITDCDYGLLLGGNPTTHHFAVTEAYSLIEGEWKLVQFSFTALIYPSNK